MPGVPISVWTDTEKFVVDRVRPYRQKVWGCAAHHVYFGLHLPFRGIEHIREVQDDWHIAGRGWAAGGANAYTGKNGELYNMRPLSWDNWCHAVRERAMSQLPQQLQDWYRRDSNAFNSHVFGCEMWGDYDVDDPKTSPAVERCAELFALICEECDLDPYKHIWPHGRPKATDPSRWGPAWKSCPGNNFDMEWFIEEVALLMGVPTPTIKRARKVVVLPGYERAMDPIFHEGAHYVSVRDVAERFDHELIDRREEDGKLYLRKRTEDAEDEEDTP
jgi:hypothetical protein